MKPVSEARAAVVAVLASAICVGGAFALATPIKWLMSSSSAQAESSLPQADVPEPDAAKASAEVVEQGHQFFTMSCVECHGDDAHGDEGPDLHNLTISNGRIAATIRHGVKGEMPNFSKKYTDAQISSLVAYLRSLR